VFSLGVELETVHNGGGENGKKMPEKVICFRWELNSRPFIMAEVDNYLENRSNCNTLFLNLFKKIYETKFRVSKCIQNLLKLFSSLKFSIEIKSFQKVFECPLGC